MTKVDLALVAKVAIRHQWLQSNPATTGDISPEHPAAGLFVAPRLAHVQNARKVPVQDGVERLALHGREQLNPVNQSSQDPGRFGAITGGRRRDSEVYAGAAGRGQGRGLEAALNAPAIRLRENLRALGFQGNWHCPRRRV
jgi:hypothetical protein